MNRKPLRDFIWSYGAPDSEGERLNARCAGERGRDMERYQRRDDDDYDHDQRHHNHGYHRHRNVSSWARNARCRSGMEDCISSNRWRPSREYPPRRSRVAPEPTLVWRKKTVQEGKKLKKVSFADPIATELKAPKPIIPDDSILLIKGNNTAHSWSQNFSPLDDVLLVENDTASHPLTSPEKEADNGMTHGAAASDNNNMGNENLNMSEQNKNTSSVSNAVPADSSYIACVDAAEPVMPAMPEREGVQELETPMFEKEGVQQALTETLKTMQKQLAMPPLNSVSNPAHPSVSITDNLVPMGEFTNFQSPNLDIQVDEIVESEVQSVHGLSVDTDIAPEIVAEASQPNHTPQEHTNTVTAHTSSLEFTQVDPTGGIIKDKPPNHWLLMM